MRSTFKVIIAGLLAIVGFSLFAFRHQQPKVPGVIREKLVAQADSFLTAVHILQATPVDAAHTYILQQRFKKLRLTYKRIEWATEYFDPVTTRQVNGPPVPETELSGQIIQPDGLQVIEQLLFPQLKPSYKKQLKALLQRLTVNAEEYVDFFKHADLQDWQTLDAVKLEVFRVEALGLNDFDDPLNHNCCAESAAALSSAEEAIMHYGDNDRSLMRRFQQAINYLRQPVVFNRFDRAFFLRVYANPLTRELTILHQQLQLPDIRYNRLLNQDAATLFDKNAFNRNAFIAAPEDSATDLKIALGKRLFFDPMLSGSNTRSCGSCHQPAKAFTDGLIKNLDITGKKTIARNTPTLINAALQPAQFYDLRAASLEDQVIDVVNNKDEMHGDMQLSIQKLWKDASYSKLFAEAFPMTRRTAIDTAEVMNALASYIRSLTSLDSRFDNYMQGNSNSLNKAEVNGFNLFMGKARCSTCHYLPLFNGTLPPRYVKMDAEVIGVPKTRNGKVIDPDQGLFGIQQQRFNRHAFKVTTVRNAARTPPYMHNGVFKTLEEVVDFYDLGGGAGMGLKVPNQTLATDRLHLTATEKKELVAFIKSLDSRQ
jgi:cytochrome c peroxidase